MLSKVLLIMKMWLLRQRGAGRISPGKMDTQGTAGLPKKTRHAEVTQLVRQHLWRTLINDVLGQDLPSDTEERECIPKREETLWKFQQCHSFTANTFKNIQCPI